MKCCTRCNQILPPELFAKNKRRPDGLASWCKACQKSYMDVYYAENRGKFVERMSEWKRDNPDRVKAHTATHYRSKKSYYHEKVHERRSLQRKSNQTDADAQFTRLLYQYAESWNSFVPERFRLHVDHIVPLKHELVCGLHTANNLQLLLAQENWSKNNAFVT